ncbi:MAG: hypothetical protein ABL993_00820 [Vicinamibacterales bacterium]
MPEHDAFAERGRALEDEYFRRKDRELVEKMRRAAAEEQARKDLGHKTGLDDPESLKALHDLGFTPDTVGLLPLVPVLQVAWAEGGITAAERSMILSLARSRGVEAGSAADRQLAEWMTTRPADAVFARAGRLIRAMLDSGSIDTANLSANDLVKYCEDIASASGGILGIGRVSAEERALLSGIAADLHARRS